VLLPAAVLGLTSVALKRCDLAANPVQSLLALPQLAAITLQEVAVYNNVTYERHFKWLPMNQPQRQLAALLGAGAAAAASATTAAAVTAAAAAAPQDIQLPMTNHTNAEQQLTNLPAMITTDTGESAADRAAVSSQDSTADWQASMAGEPFRNTSLTSLSLLSMKLDELPSCVSQLVALENLSLAHSYSQDQGLHQGYHQPVVLPAELRCLPGLQSLCLADCSLRKVPPTVFTLSGLTRLELQHNHELLAEVNTHSPGVGPGPTAAPAFRHSLRVLNMAYTPQRGSNQGLLGIPSWVSTCTALQQLYLSADCLGAPAAMASTPNQAAAAGKGGPSSKLASHSSGRRSSKSSTLQSSSSSSEAAQRVTLQQLPGLLPQLQVLHIEGQLWQQSEVRDVVALALQLQQLGSKLRLVLPP
jgi:hypothetical protein